MKSWTAFLTLVGAGGMLALTLATPLPTSMQTPAGQGARGGTGGPGGRGGGAAAPFNFADNQGWAPMFDGRSLNGWDGDQRFWSVKDGAIYVSATCEKPAGSAYLVWLGGEPADFELKWESKATGSFEGGVQYRSYLTSDPTVGLTYGGRGGGGGGRGGRGTAESPPAAPTSIPGCSNPGTPPAEAERARYNMAGPQFRLDASNTSSGQYYEQGGRSVGSSQGQVVLAEGQSSILTTLAERNAINSWFRKDDYNQFLLVVKGNNHLMFVNGHLLSVFVDNISGSFRPSGKIGIAIAGTGELFVRNMRLRGL